MLKAKIGVGLLMMVLAAVVVAGAETAAPGGPAAAPAGGGGFAGGGRGGNFDPAAMRQAMMQRIKEQLGATDQEWTVIEPKLTKVMDLSRQLQPARGGMFGRGGRGGAPAAAPTTPQTDVGKARAALQTALDDAGAKPEVIKQQLAALREAKAKVRQDLDKATADLKSVLSARQEAVLLMGGILD